MVEGAGLGIGDAFSDDERAALLALGRTRTYARNDRVFHEGDRNDFVVVVVRGRLKILATTADGRESVLGIRGPGSLVGELAAFDGGPRTASAIALDRLTARIVPGEEFRRFVGERPQAALELIRVLMRRLREGDRRRVEFGAYDATARVARLLCELADEAGVDVDAAQVVLAQHEIAGLVGASRASVARALAALRDEHIIMTSRNAVTVLDVHALRRFAS
jgi:CRP-like cAMP-binding protein